MDNRSRILSKSLELFASYGYDAVGVQRIAEAAQLTKPTLYHYFGSKKGLLHIVLETCFKDLFPAIEKAIVYNSDLPLTLNNVITVYFDFSRQNPVFYRMQLSMWFSPSQSEALEAVSSFNEKQQKLLEQIFIDAAEEHKIIKGRHQTYAATFLGLINTYIGLSLNGHIQLDQQLSHRTVHQFLHGIYS